MAGEAANDRTPPIGSPASQETAFPSRPLRGSSEDRIVERLTRGFLFLCALISVLTTVGIVVILVYETARFFGDVSPIEFFFGTEWTPLFTPSSFGVLPLVAGTLLIAVISTLVSLPLGLASAIYLSMYAHHRVRMIVKPALEVLAGIPTVVLGYFALTFITPQIIQPLFDEAGVFNALSAGLAVGILTIPMVSSLSEDAIQAVPRRIRDGAFAMGATKFEVATRVMVPSAFSGIAASVILAFSRAIGETMVVTLAAGATPNFTANPLESIQAMTAYIVQVAAGDVARGTVKYQTLFAVGFTLFLLTLAMNIASQLLVKRFREEYE